MRRFSKMLLLCSLSIAVPAFSGMQSKYVSVAKEGGATVDDRGRVGFVQIISNTSQQTLWVMVLQGDCESTKKIEAKAEALFRCDVGELKAGKVPVAITIYSDEAKSQTLESLHDEMSFGRDEVEFMKDFVAAQHLPATYDGIYYSPEFGIKAVFRQFGRSADGKLTISTSSIDYADAKQKVSIPVAMVRDVHLFNGGGQPWAVVNYLENDAKKHAGFVPLSHPKDLSKIVFSLQAAANAGGEDLKIPGESIGDSTLQRDTTRSILDSEKKLAPGCASPKVVDTKLLEKPSNVAVQGSRPVQGTWSERWIVDRCGTQVAYRVNYLIDPKGGTSIAIEKP